MATIYEYILKLNAQMDGIVAATNALKKTDEIAEKAQQSVNGLGTKLKTAFSSIPGADLLTNPIVLITAGIGAITKLGLENERTKISFDVLLGSQTKSAEMMAKMNQYADTTSYGSAEIQQAAKVMLGFGIAQDKIMPNLKMFGDVAMGDANKLNSLTLAFSQISSAGKMQGQDLLQLVTAGFNPLTEISKMTGKSMGTLRKEMEKGQISAQMVEDAFKHATGQGGLFYQMMDKLGGTLGGKLSTLLDSGKRRLLQLYEVVEPILVPAVDLLGQAVTELEIPFNAFVEITKSIFTDIQVGSPYVLALGAAIGVVAIAIGIYNIVLAASALKLAVMTWYTGLSTTAIVLNTLVTEGWSAAWLALNIAMSANPIGVVIAVIAALAAAVTYVVSKTQGWGQQWDHVVGMMKSSFSVFVDGIMIGIDKIQLGWYKFKNLLGFGNKIENNNLINQLNSDVERRKKEIQSASDKFKQNAKWDITWSTDEKTKKSGIAPAKVPGQNGGTGTGVDPTKEGTKKVTAGGTRNTSIVIHLGKMVESIVFQGGVKENSQDLTRQVEEALLRVLYAAESAS